jgi:hypothetical protein
VTIGGGRRPGGARFSTAAALPDVTRHEGSVSMPAAVVTGFEMLRRKLPRRGALLAVVLMLAACTAADDDGPEVAPIEDLGTEEESAETEEVSDVDDGDAEGGQPADEPDGGAEQADDATEAADADPYAIPEGGIDEAYVERVLNAIFEVNREALAITLESEPGGLAPFEAEERLRAIYSGDYGIRQQLSLSEIAEHEEQRESFMSPVGAVAITVDEIIDADPDCVVARRRSDFGAVLLDPGEPRQDFVALEPKSAGDDPQAFNPTPWVLADANIDAPERLECS